MVGAHGENFEVGLVIRRLVEFFEPPLQQHDISHLQQELGPGRQHHTAGALDRNHVQFVLLAQGALRELLADQAGLLRDACPEQALAELIHLQQVALGLADDVCPFG